MKLLQLGTPHGALSAGQDEPVVEEPYGSLRAAASMAAVTAPTVTATRSPSRGAERRSQPTAISTTASAASMLSVHQHATASAGRSVPALMPTGVSPLGAVMKTAARSKAAR
jgi:hypothetical protein